MSTRQPVRRAARRAFCPSLPIASESWSSGTITVACFASSSTSTSRTQPGESALATKRAGSSLTGVMSIFSPRSSHTPTLTHAGGRERLGHGAGGLLVEGDDVDLLAAELRHDHPHARPARADARPDRV